MDDTESIAVAVAVVGDYLKQNPSLKAVQTLEKIIRNAVENPRHCQFKLQSPSAQKYVVSVPGALDILGIVGFFIQGEGPQEMAVFPETPLVQNRSLIRSVLTELQAHSLQNDPAGKCSGGSTFLSPEEREKRQRKAKAARAAQRLEREREMQRFTDDQKESRSRKKQRMATKSQKNGPISDTILNPGIPVSGKTSDSPEIRLSAGSASRLLNPDKSRLVSRQKSPAAKAKAPQAPVQTRSSTGPKSPPTAAATSGSGDRTVASSAATVKKGDQNSPGSGKKPSEEELKAEKHWKQLTKTLGSCAAAAGIRDTSSFTKVQDSSPLKCLKRLYKELNSELPESLPCDRASSIWVRYDEDTPQFMRAMISAPLQGTPYSGGLFIFDIYVPNSYPQVPPKMTLLTTGSGSVRFGPNLYGCGKVCLSLLGTWSGPQWSPSHSNLYQVLVSIQGLILGVEQPYYLEPGYGGWEADGKPPFASTGQGSSDTAYKVQLAPHIMSYNLKIRIGTLRYAILEHLRLSVPHSLLYTAPFAEIMETHFACSRVTIAAEIGLWKKQDAGQLNGLVDAVLGKLEELSVDDAGGTLVVRNKAKGAAQPKDDDGCRVLEEDGKMDSRLSVTTNTPIVGVKPTSVKGDDKLDELRKKLDHYAKQEDFIMAGKIQENLQQLEQLREKMLAAAAEGNYIKAGRTQEQFNALLEDDPSRAECKRAYDPRAQQEGGFGVDALMEAGELFPEPPNIDIWSLGQTLGSAHTSIVHQMKDSTKAMEESKKESSKFMEDSATDMVVKAREESVGPSTGVNPPLFASWSPFGHPPSTLGFKTGGAQIGGPFVPPSASHLYAGPTPGLGPKPPTWITFAAKPPPNPTALSNQVKRMKKKMEKIKKLRNLPPVGVACRIRVRLLDGTCPAKMMDRRDPLSSLYTKFEVDRSLNLQLAHPKTGLLSLTEDGGKSLEVLGLTPLATLHVVIPPPMTVEDDIAKQI